MIPALLHPEALQLNGRIDLECKPQTRDQRQFDGLRTQVLDADRVLQWTRFGTRLPLPGEP